MRSHVIIVLATGLGGALAAGCGPIATSAQTARTTVDVTPGNRPGFVGGYDFELLEPVEGTACVSLVDTSAKWGAVPGFDLPGKEPLRARAEAAATYDALEKIQNADTILVTRVKSISDGPAKMCSTVYGRAVRLMKGTAPPPAPAPTF